jgi:hypothetical protein
LIISQWFPPEPAPIGIMLNEIAEGMIARGNRVTVITGFPNHPDGRIYGGFKKRLWQTFDSKGVKIVRVYLYVPRSFSDADLHNIFDFILHRCVLCEAA